MRILKNIAIDLSSVGDLARVAARELGVGVEAVAGVDVLRRSIDARGRHPHLVMTLRVRFPGDPPLPSDPLTPITTPVVARRDKRVVIVGTGPAGLFAALRFADAGVPVVVLERGAALAERHKRARLLRAERILDPESNLCFGEGGAGTYSDGKLYTRKSSPRVREVYERLVRYGADPSILVDAHPHVGTNRLIPLIEALRADLLGRSIDLRFDTRMEGLEIRDGRVRAVETWSDGAGSGSIPADAVILATGHSARDTYARLAALGVAMAPKAFAVGARVEHPQALIDRIQLGTAAGHPALGAAEYFLACQVGPRGVYSFCMCPGGFVIPTPTELGHLNVNGMSNASRKNYFANAALVSTVSPEDFATRGDPLEGLAFQRQIERAAFEVGGGDYSAPATRLTDFAAGRGSTTLPSRTSYRPGLTPADIRDVLPPAISAAIAEALGTFERRMRGYLTSEAVIVAAETTTSSPIRVLRGDDLQSTTVRGLYPTGEGAGYAGGIVSSAIDGMVVAERILAEA